MKVAILGTGVIGTALAELVIKAGHETIIYNRTKSKTEPLLAIGAKVSMTATEAIKTADATIIALTNAAGVRKLLLNETTKEVLKGKKILNASATAPDEIEKMAQDVAKHGGSLAEMLILVSPEQLRYRHGEFLIGCNNEDEKFWQEILECIGEKVHRIGEVGDASRAKSPLLWFYVH